MTRAVAAGVPTRRILPACTRSILLPEELLGIFPMFISGLVHETNV
jgi:hypothetical protein